MAHNLRCTAPKLVSFGRPLRQLSMWNHVEMAPPDKILGLNEAFKKDPCSSKINLTVGAYRNDDGKPEVLQSIRVAEQRILNQGMDHEYGNIAGLQEFVDLSLQFAYGTNCSQLNSNTIAGIQALSGTGACRLFGEFIANTMGRNTPVYIPNPTWPNHMSVMKHSGLNTINYDYYNPMSKSFNMPGFMKDIAAAPNRSVFLLHACAHNPTGCDPSQEQWRELSRAMLQKQHLVFFDCAYQGFASGDAERDAFAIRQFVQDGHLVLVAQSFAKNFGLYGERIGALSVMTESVDEQQRVLSQLKVLARAMYSNPPLYGARLVTEVLRDQQLRSQWTAECRVMADRIQAMRVLLRGRLEQHTQLSWQHVTDQIGMFCYSSLTPAQVTALRTEHHIYCTQDGRVSMAGVNTHNVEQLATAVAKVLR